MKEEYIHWINELMNQTNDIVLIDFIYKFWVKAGSAND